MIMKKYTQNELINLGYRIENARITKADLSMADHGCFTLSIVLDGNSWGVVYGGYCLGHGYLGANDFDGSAAGMESIMRIMDVVGVERFQDLQNKYVRVATKGWNGPVKIIGNVLKDQWFDIETFFADKKEDNK
jgi:hypothetical protein